MRASGEPRAMTAPNLSHITHPPEASPAGVFFDGRCLACASLLAAAIAAAMAGCATSPGGPARGAPSSSAERPPARERVSDAPVPGRAIATPLVDAAVRLDVRQLGVVATDGFTLPLLSPSGTFMAVQTGTPPDTATALARPGQREPRASRIALYKLGPGGITRLGETDGGLILGRSADERGFLVESPRPDGARWIGRIRWGTEGSTDGYEPEWLVQDGAVNAFAALGPNGELAYSRREISERFFDLVVRRADSTVRLGADGLRSLTFPSFNADGSRVYTLLLRDGILELGSTDPASDESMSQGLVRLFVSDRADDSVAAQMATPQATRDGTDGRDLVFFHPTLGTIARWNDADGLRALPGRVLAVAKVDERRDAVLDGSRVRMRVRATGTETQASSDARSVEILDRIAVPRALGMVEGSPGLLLIAPEASGVRLSLVRLLN